MKAIAAGDYNYCNVYQNTTVLQADMVGFTVLSAKYPPERVLGILSDIFEEVRTGRHPKPAAAAAPTAPLPSSLLDVATPTLTQLL